ncbi:hypothetical protein JCM3765_004279 [Sporobolomyces pararoseus]
MPTQLLPTELYTQILSNLASSTSDLYHCLFISRAFCGLVKPILYQNITITTRHQRSRLLKVKKEDKRLVQKLTLSGRGCHDPIDMEDHLKVEDYALGKNLVKDLLTGKLLDITAIRVLHIRHVREDPNEVLGSKLSPFDLRPALKLVELSINGHQGGGMIWDVYLGFKVPSLRRLAYVEVTEYYRARGSLSFELDVGFQEFGESSSSLPPRTPYSQLQVLVATPSDKYHGIRNFPLDNFFAVLQIEDLAEPDLPITFPNCCIIPEDPDYCLVDASLTAIQGKVSHPDNRIVALHLPVCNGCPDNEEYHACVEFLRSKGVKVHEVEEISHESNSLIFDSFVNYLEKNGKLVRG